MPIWVASEHLTSGCGDFCWDYLPPHPVPLVLKLTGFSDGSPEHKSGQPVSPGHCNVPIVTEICGKVNMTIEYGRVRKGRFLLQGGPDEA